MLASVTATAAVEAHCVWVYRLIRAFLALGVGATLFFASVGVLTCWTPGEMWMACIPYPRAMAIS
jgi:hypothetical protein